MNNIPNEQTNTIHGLTTIHDQMIIRFTEFQRKMERLMQDEKLKDAKKLKDIVSQTIVQAKKQIAPLLKTQEKLIRRLQKQDIQQNLLTHMNHKEHQLPKTPNIATLIKVKNYLIKKLNQSSCISQLNQNDTKLFIALLDDIINVQKEIELLVPEYSDSELVQLLEKVKKETISRSSPESKYPDKQYQKIVKAFCEKTSEKPSDNKYSKQDLNNNLNALIKSFIMASSPDKENNDRNKTLQQKIRHLHGRALMKRYES